ncbi:PREDICTED: B3 domain-containing protein Os01g0723500-like [Nelumbo nucifera]|uniref:B3 domain-containing protein Os01g0723500-like n=1 Tax=Nelumbo nucifera TaxID=4432 RepID=A0A1U8AB15_NELNU|nr:PREDICTED: B3 domain-containing protein Os01g0723500-like [Nelumbo nucifera]
MDCTVANSCRRNRPSFFKVLLRREDFRLLRIPPSFIKHFNGSVSKASILRGPTGKPLHVKVKWVKKQLFFCNGWGRFVKHHSLALGEFLVFRYHGNSKFSVKVYDASACEKEVPSLEVGTQGQSHPYQDQENQIRLIARDIKKEPVADCYTTEENQGRSSMAKHIKKEEIVADSCPRKETQGKILSKKLKKEVKIGSCRKKENQGKPLAKDIKKETIVSGVVNCGYVNGPKRRAVIKARNAAFEAACSYKTEHPHFTIPCCESRKYQMTIPKAFAEENVLGSKVKTMLLWDPEGRPWPVKVKKRTDGRVDLGSGMVQFWKANSIEEGDACTFELKGNSFCVKIFRTKGFGESINAKPVVATRTVRRIQNMI